MSGEMPEPITGIARHAWIYGRVNGRAMRWELYPENPDADPFSYFGDGEVAVHGIVKGTDAEMATIAACFDRSTNEYPKRHPTYNPIPGPNSNTIVAEALRDCGVHVELPASCIGRDYLGVAGVARTEGGTGVQAETWLAGVRVGLREGVEAHFFALAVGVHIWPPGITVPTNPAGRFGMDFDAYRDDHHVSAQYSLEREFGVASAWISANGALVKDSARAGGLEGVTTLGLSGRGLFAKNTLGYAIGADLEMGAGYPLGFAYRADLMPIGGGVAFGSTGFLMLLAGAGTSGVTARVENAFEVPLEARLEFDVIDRTRLGMRGTWFLLPTSDSRDNETTLSVFARLGPTKKREGFFGGHGPWLSLERHTFMHTYWLGVSLGSAIDFGG